jgi:uncharacterized SAM-binding protein YcdF (DUF218 family)
MDQSLAGLKPGSSLEAHIRTVWDYLRLQHQLVKADAILVLCSYDTTVAVRAAELFLERWAPLLIFAGGHGAITCRLWDEAEADRFARIAVDLGVPRERILVENQSTNTGENIRFTRQLLADQGLDPQTFIVVQKPYMERRSYATFKQQWPGKALVVTSPVGSLDEYLTEHVDHPVSPDEVISVMVGDLQRIRLYPALGFQIEQEIPDEVWAAFQALVDAGYDRHLIRGGV